MEITITININEHDDADPKVKVSAKEPKKRPVPIIHDEPLAGTSETPGIKNTAVTGERIKQERDALHMTQSVLAQKLGTSTGLLSNWESGRAHPKDASLEKFSRALGVDKAYLAGEQDERR